MGYEKSAHLYDLFDTKENVEFFFRYASEAGEENEGSLTPACGGSTSFILNEVEGLTTLSQSKGGIFDLILPRRPAGLKGPPYRSVGRLGAFGSHKA